MLISITESYDLTQQISKWWKFNVNLNYRVLLKLFVFFWQRGLRKNTDYLEAVNHSDVVVPFA